MMLADPSKKYRRMYQRVDLPDRQWPNNEINQAPIWMSTDLRDGNQAIFEPMNMDQKLKMFHMLVKIGFKHIEIGFPSASQIDFDFTQKLIQENLYAREAQHQESSKMVYIRRMGKAVICFHHQPFKIMIRFCSYINHLTRISLGENASLSKRSMLLF